jgi:hypothetical protein
MPQYAAKAREQYKKDNDKNKFITNVWNDIIANSKGKDIAKKATIAFLNLTKSNGRGSWIDGTEILKKAIGRKTYKHNVHYGLWPWVEGTGAGIIQEAGSGSQKQYKVKTEFYGTMCAVCK